jgi:hypothetical protein
MARQARIEILDDFDGSPADETLEYTFDGVDYISDLTAENAATFRAQLRPWLDAAWSKKRARGRVGRPKKQQAIPPREPDIGEYIARNGQGAPSKSLAIPDPVLRAKVRAWAEGKKEFRPLPPGYIRADVQEAYKAAHGGKLE